MLVSHSENSPWQSPSVFLFWVSWSLSCCFCLWPSSVLSICSDPIPEWNGIGCGRTRIAWSRCSVVSNPNSLHCDDRFLYFVLQAAVLIVAGCCLCGNKFDVQTVWWVSGSSLLSALSINVGFKPRPKMRRYFWPKALRANYFPCLT